MTGELSTPAQEQANFLIFNEVFVCGNNRGEIGVCDDSKSYHHIASRQKRQLSAPALIPPRCGVWDATSCA